MPSGRPRSAGFAYVLLLVLIAVLFVAAASMVSLGHNVSRRHAEESLLAIGEDFTTALASYRQAGGVGGNAGPAALVELLRDPRMPGVRRHLREIPADPLTGRAEWGLVRDSAGRIVAIHSLAPGIPIKRDGFDTNQAEFINAGSYADWRFRAAVERRPLG